MRSIAYDGGRVQLSQDDIDGALYLYGSRQMPVPEPTTLLLFGIGLLGIAGVSRKKKAIHL